MNKINTEKIPQEVVNCIKNLENKGFEAFLVGGCVRDLLMERTPNDWDLTTNATPSEIIDVFDETIYENNFGTVGVKTENEDSSLKVIEITPYRLESNYIDKRHPEKVTFSKKIEDDLKRRDFTINAMAYNPSKGEIIDNYGGQKDIKDKIIRTVGDPDERFNEDSLRMLRAVRFSAQLCFTINIDTAKSIENNNKSFENVSRERIKEEFTKIILSDNPMIGMALTQKLGLLPYISKNLEDMVGVTQNKKAHKYDVWEHALRALQHAADNNFSLEVRLAALFHDVSKVETKREKGGESTFFGHDVVGARVTRETLKKLTFSKEIINKTVKLVRWHMFYSDTEEITLSAVRRLIRKVGKDNIWDLINLRKADRIGMGRPKEEPYRLRKFQSMIDEVMRDPISVNMLKINGDIIINDLKIPAGPRIGYILHALLEEVLDDPQKNNEQYLINRSGELNNLEEKELEKLGTKAREKKEELDDEEVSKLRGKRYVK